MAGLTTTLPAGPVSADAARVAGPVPADRTRPALVAVVGACHGCGACLLTCPTHALRPVSATGTCGGPARLVVLAERCTGCGECLEICPVDAITLREAA